MALVTLSLAAALWSGCGLLGQVVGEVNQAETVLENAIERLDAQASNWRQILESTLDELPDTQQSIKADVSLLMHDAVGLVGVEARCEATFVPNLIKAELQNILAAAKGKRKPVPKPMLCFVNPPVVDLNLRPNQRNVIKIYGYFFQRQRKKLTLEHRRSSGNPIDASRHINVSTDFQLIIDVGKSGAKVDDSSRKLVLKYKGKKMSEIDVVAKELRACKSRVREVVLSPMRLVPKHKTNPRNNKRGDGEFNGNGPCISAEAKLYTKNDREIWVAAKVEAWECADDFKKLKWDYTYGAVSNDDMQFASDPGWRIRSIVSPASSELEFIDKDEQHNRVNGQGAVLSWLVVGDTKGNDLGTTAVTINFASVRIEEEQDGDCTHEG